MYKIWIFNLGLDRWTNTEPDYKDLENALDVAVDTYSSWDWAVLPKDDNLPEYLSAKQIRELEV